MEPITSRVAYEVTVGNHEYDHVGLGLTHPALRLVAGTQEKAQSHETWATIPGGMCRTNRSRFNGTGNGGLFWYSFEEAGPCSGIIQRTRLESGSRCTNGSKLTCSPSTRKLRHGLSWRPPHDVHHPAQRRSGLQGQPAFRKRRAVAEQVQVNLMLVGHQHSYERSCAVSNGTCVEDGASGTTHLVGSAGANKEKGGFSPKFGNYSVKHLDDYGYIRVDSNRTRMFVEFVRTNKHDNVPAGEVWDSVEILPWV